MDETPLTKPSTPLSNMRCLIQANGQRVFA